MIKVATDLSLSFLKIAEENRKKAEEALNKAIAGHDTTRGKYIDEERKHSLFSILFSALALEAYINSFGFENLKPTEWRRIKEFRPSVKVKWLLLPKAVTGQSFDPENGLFKNFCHLIDIRNFIVHYKSFEFKSPVKHPSGTDVSAIYNITSFKEANLAYTTAKEMIEKLEEFKANTK